MTECQKHLAKTLNQTDFHLYSFLLLQLYHFFYLFFGSPSAQMFSKAIHFEEKSSYGCFWKNNFCHLSFCFNLYTSHKTCEQAATSVHEKSTQNKQQQLACCPAKVIFP